MNEGIIVGLLIAVASYAIFQATDTALVRYITYELESDLLRSHIGVKRLVYVLRITVQVAMVLLFTLVLMALKQLLG